MIKNMKNYFSFFKGNKCFGANPGFIEVKRKVLTIIMLGGSVRKQKLLRGGEQLIVELPGIVSIQVQKAENEFKATTYQKTMPNCNSINKQEETLYMICNPLTAQISSKIVSTENSFSSTMDKITSTQTVEKNLFSTLGDYLLVPDVAIQTIQAVVDSSVGEAHARELKSVLAPEEIENMIELGNAVEISLEHNMEKLLLP